MDIVEGQHFIQQEVRRLKKGYKGMPQNVRNYKS